MKNILFLCCFSSSLFSFGQAVYTKDNVYIGEKPDFMKECVGAAEDELMNISGYTIETEKYCSCMCDNVIPQLYSKDLEAAAESDNMVAFLTQGDNLTLIMECLEGNYTIEDNYLYSQETVDELTRTVMITSCSQELINDPEAAAIFTEEMATEFCTCAVDELIAKGYTYEQIMQAEDENSQAFNELVLPCVMKVMGEGLDLEEEVSLYNPDDIIGNLRSTRVPLTDYLKQGYKVKIDIGGVSKYFLLDTGASDLLISSELEKELLKKGAIQSADYAGESEYTLANGETVIARVVYLSNIQMGDYTINNVVAGIIEGGSLLCGNSLLGKFSHWEIDQKNMQLILYK